MRWKRVVIVAVIGGLLGFGGQLVADFFCWSPIISNGTQRPPGFEFIFSGSLDRLIVRHNIQAQQMLQARALWFQGTLLLWLGQRGEIIDRITLWGAFVGATAALAFDQKRKASAVTTSAKQTKIAANQVAEPKDNVSDQEPSAPAQIEMTKAAAVLKSAPKKEHIEA
jgi:hypothetical protein